MENIIEFDDNANVEEQIEELEKKLEKMNEDREKKCKAAKDQLINMLDVTADKYLTATGIAEALRVLRFIWADEGPSGQIDMASSLAYTMSKYTREMMQRAKDLPYKKMDSLCENFYDPNFAVKDHITAAELAEEMMCIDLCRNVGGAAEDMVAFIERVDEEIKATEQTISNLKSQEE